MFVVVGEHVAAVGAPEVVNNISVFTGVRLVFVVVGTLAYRAPVFLSFPVFKRVEIWVRLVPTS